MERRNFLKSIGLLAGASVVSSLPEFKPAAKPVQEFYHFEDLSKLREFQRKIEYHMMFGGTTSDGIINKT